jgi:hypothetical protein
MPVQYSCLITLRHSTCNETKVGLHETKVGLHETEVGFHVTKVDLHAVHEQSDTTGTTVDITEV